MVRADAVVPIGTEMHMADRVLLDEFARVRKSFIRSVTRQAKRAGVQIGGIDQSPVEATILGEMAPLFAQTWLAKILRSALAQYSASTAVTSSMVGCSAGATRPARGGSHERKIQDSSYRRAPSHISAAGMRLCEEWAKWKAAPGAMERPISARISKPFQWK